MKKLLFIFGLIALISGFKSPIDDTASLQSQINLTVHLVLPGGHGNYYTSASLILPAGHSVEMAGNFIIGSQVAGALVKMNSNCKISGGTLQGPWIVTDPGNAGSSGVQMLAGASNDTVTNMRIRSFSSYGFVAGAGAGNNIVFTNNSIVNTGYIGFYYDPEADGRSGVTFTGNTVDRSAVPASTIQEGAVTIRATASSTLPDTLSNCTISHNAIIMPLNPSNSAAECIELRNAKNSTIAYNVLTQSTIGVSLGRDHGVAINNNTITNTKLEGIEFYDSHDCSASNNNINGSVNDGIFLDGLVQRCHRIMLNFDTIENTGGSSVHCYYGTRRVTINNCWFKTAKYGVNLQQSDTLTLNNTIINGQSISGTSGVYIESAPGNVNFNSGSVINCSSIVRAYNVTTGAVVNNIIGLNLVRTGTPIDTAKFFLNGAHYGTNIHFTYNTLTFNSISGKIYGASDFDPGAISSLPITYSSANTAIATIVSGKVHIVKVGTVNITASNGDTSAVQPVTISKTPLTIYADNQAKTVGSANPALTATFYGFVNGETNSILTAQPVLSTSAGTSSPAGTYAINISGATAVNYTITQVAGVLTIKPLSTAYGPVIYKKAHVIK